MGRIDEHRRVLRTLRAWEPYLLDESGLPGPRANLELLHAVMEEGTTAQFLALLASTPERAPTGTREEFLAACGAAGLGAIIARGEEALWPRLRALASDPRWRVREAVAMGLQRVGDADMDRLLRAIGPWASGTLLERRAAAAGVCEPRLLRQPHHALEVLALVEAIMGSFEREADRSAEEYRVLRQGLGYCWSVAIVATPAEGMAALERWAASPDPDVRWVVRENLGKKRLQRLDPAWVDAMAARVAPNGPRGRRPGSGSPIAGDRASPSAPVGEPPMTAETYLEPYPEAGPIFDAVRLAVRALGGVTEHASTSQIAYRRARTFAWVWVPRKYLRRDGLAPLVLSVALRRRDDSARWKQVVEPRADRFTHHVELRQASEVDDDVHRWLAEAWGEAA
jgi:hypothetical protein